MQPAAIKECRSGEAHTLGPCISILLNRPQSLAFFFNREPLVFSFRWRRMNYITPILRSTNSIRTRAVRLLKKACSAAEGPPQLRVVEQYLNRKLASALPIHPAVSYGVERLSREGGVRSVRRIQLEIGLSHTRFIQLFREHVGLTPKLFCRVRRFHGLLNRIEKGLPVNWAELAADCGYFDQAHLIRDFRSFAGVTPLEYSRAMADSYTRFRIAADKG